LLEGWCFVINTGDEQSAQSLFLETWFSRPPGSRFFLPGTLTLLALTVLGSLGLMAGEIPRLEALRLKFRHAAVAPILSMILTWLAGGLLAAVFWTALDADAATPLNVSARAEARMTYLLCALLLLWIAAALSLAAAAADDSRNPASSAGGMRRLWPALLVAICALAAISELVLRPARSDIARRIASICEASGNYPGAVQVYERAVELSPRTAANHLSLGFARSRAAMAEKGQGRETMLEAAAQSYTRALEINPLDPAAQRAAAFFYIQTGESLADPRQRDATLRRALPFLDQAARLAPAYPDAYAELGRCYLLLGEEARAGELYSKALQLNPLFSRTHMFIGEMHYRRKNYRQALDSFLQASQNDWQNLDARKSAAAMLVLLGRGQKAVEIYLEALEIWPQDPDLLRRLAELYFSLDDYDSGVTYARRAYAVLTPGAAGSFDAFLQQLRDADTR
jgi:tetratricopeptide (TPR) repeat protein